MKNTALITGASSGIWKELAYIHAENNWDLVLVARRRDALEEIQKDIQEKHWVEVVVISKDLTLLQSPRELYDEIQKLWITIDYLINNAGFWGQGFFHERQWEDEKNMMQLNMLTLTELTKYFVDEMVERKSGRVLNVGSTASFMPGPLQAVYFATKSYVKSFSNALHRELRWSWVTVTNLMPWATETDFEKVAGLENTELFKHTVPARGVAEDGYQAMIDGKIDVISGLTFMQKILIWALPLLPKKVILNMVYDMQKKK